MLKLYILFLVLISNFLFSQNGIDAQLTDSLKLVLDKSKSTPKKIEILYKLGEEYSNFDLSLMSNCANEISNLIGSEPKYNRYKGLYYNLVSLEYIFSGKIAQALFYLKKAEKLLNNEFFLDYYLDNLYLQMTAYFYNTNFTDGKLYLDKGIDVSIKYRKNKHLSSFHAKKAQFYEVKRDHEKILDYYLKADSVLNKRQYHKHEISDFISRRIEIYCGISSVYIKNQNFDKAYEYASKALNEATNKSYTNKFFLAKAYTMFASVQMHRGKYNEVLKYINNSVSINKLLNDRYGLGFNIDLLSNYFVKVGDYNKAIQQSNILLKQFDNFHYSKNAYYYLAVSNYHLNDLKNAVFYKNKMIEYLNPILTKEKENPLYSEMCNYISLISHKNKEYDEAVKYLRLYQELSLYQQKRVNSFSAHQLQMNFESNQKDLAIKELQIQKQKHLFDIEKNQSNFKIIIVVCICLLVFSLIVSYTFKTTKRINNLLEVKNSQLEKTKTALIQSLSEKEILLKEVHHRVKNNLQLMMSLLSIQSREVKNIEIKTFLEKAQSRIASMSLIHQHLYQTEDFTKIDFQLYLENLSSYVIQANCNENSSIDVIISAKSIYFDIDRAIPIGLIVNELIMNSLKHSFKDLSTGTIEINIEKKQDKFSLVYQDNGFFDYYKYNKGNKKSIGLQLIDLLVLQINASIEKPSTKILKYIINF